MSHIVRFSKKIGLLNAFEQTLSSYRALVYERCITPFVQQEYSFDQAETRGPVILVIEDNPDEWLLIRWTLLQQFPDIETVWAHTVQDATTYFKKCTNEKREFPNLILVDLYLPTAKLGLGVIKALKTHRFFQTIPLVTISRSGLEEDINMTYGYSSDFFITKPDNYTDWKKAFSSLEKFLPRKHVDV